ncbi:heat shock protein Hsp-12.2-like [Mercenaria mercenaria]|uniref:heat shock protein Hsp-12.2-like n=1 Tax=Mercenaria mercenaria TaxID=6596 RepID=UPI00234FAE03|nr:heat shock protein Hsp-12.2-like [Mercenaria mercenaria]
MPYNKSLLQEVTVLSQAATDYSGNRKLSLRFDCSHFQPKEIGQQSYCMLMPDTLRNGGCKRYQELTRAYILPDNVDPNQLKSHLSSDGVLDFEAPAPKAVYVEAPKEVLIPIEHLHSKETFDKGGKNK